MWPNPQFPADLITLTEEILGGKLHFCAVSCGFDHINLRNPRWETSFLCSADETTYCHQETTRSHQLFLKKQLKPAKKVFARTLYVPFHKLRLSLAPKLKCALIMMKNGKLNNTVFNNANFDFRKLRSNLVPKINCALILMKIGTVND